MKKMFVVVFLIVVVSVMAAQPFGVRMGNTIMNLVMLGCNPTLLDGESYIYEITPRKPSLPYKTYFAYISKTYGVYRIVGVSDIMFCGQDGAKLKDTFYAARKQLNATYGKSENKDYLMKGSAWNKPKDWMMALYKNERVLSSCWESFYGSRLPEDIGKIILGAEALTSLSGRILVIFDSANADKA